MVAIFPLSAALSVHAQSLIASLTKDNVAVVAQELLQLANVCGSEIYSVLLRALVDPIEFKEGLYSTDQPQVEVLKLIWASLLKQSSYSTVLAKFLSDNAPHNSNEGFLAEFCQALKLPLGDQLLLGIAAAESHSALWRGQAINFLKDRLRLIHQSSVVVEVDTLHRLLVFVQSDPELFDSSREYIEGLQSRPALDPILTPLVVRDVYPSNLCRGGELDLNSLATMTGDLFLANNLSRLMQDLGYASTADETSFRTVALQIPVLNEKDVAEVLSLIVRTMNGMSEHFGMQSALNVVANGLPASSDSVATTWNMKVVIDVLKELLPALSWPKVVEELDHEGFVVPDQSAFMLLVSAYKRATVEPFPVAAVTSKVWHNAIGQLGFLKFAVAAPPDVFSFEHCLRRIAPVEGLHGGKSPYGTPNHAFLCLDLFETLVQLATTNAQLVRPILEYALKQCPEVLLIAVASSRTNWSTLEREIVSILMPQYLANNPNSAVVMHRLWNINRTVLVQSFVEWYEQDNTHVSRILDICQELKSLTQVLDMTPFQFSVELAALAARREYLNLEKWLNERIARDGVPFSQAVLRFLDLRTQQSPDLPQVPGQPARINLSVDTLKIFCRVLQSTVSAGTFPPEFATEYKRVQAQAVKHYPALQAVLSPVQQQPNDAFASDVEEEANSYFQKIYSEQKPVEEVVHKMKQFKSSQSSRDQEVFACMIHNLFDEYRFYVQYPDKELHITAVLFGALINHQLVSSITLGIALRYVLDALKKPPGNKMLKFGLDALHQFKGIVYQYPQFLAHVLQIPHLREADPELYAQLERSKSEQVSGDAITAPPSEEQPAIASPSAAATKTLPYPTSAVSVMNQLLGQQHPMQSQLLNLAQSAADAAESPRNEPARADIFKPVLGTSITGGADPSQGFGNMANLQAASVGVQQAQLADEVLDSPELVSGQEALTKSGSASLAAQVAGNALAPNAPSLASVATINTETLETAAEKYTDFKSPPDHVVDKILFVMNNVAVANVEAKAAEIREKVLPDFLHWFANYLVVKRAAQEANFHNLYISLSEKMNDKELTKDLVKTTHYYVKVLLDSDRIIKDSNERALLKNLGTWLGLLTFAKNKPVLAKELDLKQIIIDAYQKGRMIAVLPFVKSVLEQCKGSKVFKPSNPMVSGILSLLAEIHGMKGLKMNVVFSIELAFKAFELSPADVKPSDTLKNIARETLQNPDWGIEAPSVSPPPAPPEPKPTAPPPHSQSLTSTPPRPQSDLQPFKAPASSDAITVPVSQVPAPSASPAVPSAAAADQGLFANLHAYVQINPSLGVIAERLQLKRVVPIAVDRAICEIITPVVERSVTIACYTTYELIMKDFALEPDEQRMRKAAHLMVSSLAGSLALVTCKDPLRVSLCNQLRQMLQGNVEQNMIEQAVQLVVNENLELGCTIIERAATDKAVRDIDKSLQPAYESRQKAKSVGQNFYDMSMFDGRFPGGLPESLKPKPGHVQAHQQRVYEDFAKIPKTQSPAVSPTVPAQSAAQTRPYNMPAPAPAVPGVFQNVDLGGVGAEVALPEARLERQAATAAMSDKYLLWQTAVDVAISKEAQGLAPDNSELQGLITELSEVVHSVGASIEDAGLFLAKRILKHVYEGSTKLHYTFHVTCLEVLVGLGCKRLPLEVAQMFCAVEDDRKYNKDIGELLLRNRLFSLPELDAYFVKVITTTRSPALIDFVMHLVKACIIRDQVINYAELYNTLEVIGKLAQRAPGFEGVLQIIDQAKKASSLRYGDRTVDIPGIRDKQNEPAAMREQFKGLYEEWLRVISTQADEKAHAQYVLQLRGAGFLKMDETTDRFLCQVVDMSVQHCLNSEQAQANAGRSGELSFMALDAFVRLTACIVVNGGTETFLTRALAILVGVVKRDADERLITFNPRPYLRVFVGLMSELGVVEPTDTVGIRYLRAIGLALHNLQPLSVPGFAFAWIELISHRAFMPKLLMAQQAQGWILFEALLVALLRFLEPYLRTADLSESIRHMYKGTLRVLLVLLHDFPEFLCEHHFQLCDVIPTSCIQMRNLILSAFPRNMRLPDPFTPNLKVDLLPEISQPPRILVDPEKLLPEPLRSQVDAYLRTRQPATVMTDLLKRLALPPDQARATGSTFNVPLINALVLYIGIQGKPGATPAPQAMEIFQRLASDMDTEGRYMLLNAIANKLRYPNSHTHYFSCVLLHLFAEAKLEIVQEQITRVLLERLIVNRPHPWGLLITFIELIKNPRYNFWSHSFTRCAPEIERLFESVARSCMGPTPRPEEDLSIQGKETAVRG